MKTCPKCSLVFDDSAEKCTYCGYEFPIAESQNAPVQNNDTEQNQNGQNNDAPPCPPHCEANQQYSNINNQPNPNTGYRKPVKYCPHCGNECDINAIMCVKCGMQLQNINQPIVNDVPSTGLKLLCFFFPIAGLIFYLVDKDKKPVSSRVYGKMALIGFIVGTVFSVLMQILGFFISLLTMADGASYEYSFGDSDFYYSMIQNIWFMLK